MNASRVLVVFTLSIVPLPLLAQAKPPVAPVREVTDTYFGQTIVDPYRWMEKQDPEFMQWLRDEDSYTRLVLHSIPGRDKIIARLTELDNAVASITQLQRAGEDLYFYKKSEPGANIGKLYVRKGLGGTERLLVDPDTMSTKEHHYAMDYFAPSLDGIYVAYGISQGGSEIGVLHVIETATLRVLPDAIGRTEYFPPSWLPDGKSFLYWRMNKLAPGAPPTEVYRRSRMYLHVLGNDPDEDRLVFGYGITPGVTEDDFSLVRYTPGAPYLVGNVRHGVKDERIYFVARLTDLKKASIVWKKVADESDDVTSAAIRGNDVYLLTHKNAPRYKVLKTSLIHPDFATATTVIAPGETVVTDIEAAKDSLYVQLLDGGITRITRVSYANRSVEEIPLPVQGTASLSADPRYGGALINLTSWTQSPLWYRFTPEDKKLIDTGLQPPSPVDTSNYESREVKAKSADGTMVPLSIVLRKGTPLDGSHPTLLNGYGAYGDSILPSFDPKLLPWLELGGIIANAHVRGGGEYGEEWHAAGQKKTKMNTIDDFIACAEYLIDQKYTSASKLAGLGTSAGGILIGRAITKRPDLFAAAISRVGASNPLRFEVTQGGPANIPEYGTVANRDEFEALRTFDPYLNVQPNTKYPAVLLTTGLNDPRVPPWQPGKMAARLQASSTSGRPVLLRVDFDAGHGGFGSTRSQLREGLADLYAFLMWQFGEPAFQPN